MKQKLLLLLAISISMVSSAWADLSTTTINEKTYYQIGTAADLVELATLVNGGEFTANAILTEDIDMSSLASWTAIGDWGGISGTSSACYKGHFDGQGHKITGFNHSASHNYFGIFGVISSCLIENFSVYGTISTGVATAGGVAGYARDATPTIRNVHSYVNINNTANGKKVGGILGTSHNGTVVVDRCTYSGTLDGKDSDKNGNYGGIVGYVNNNANAKLQVTNCLFDGILKNTAGTPGSCTFGGIVGYVGANITDMAIKNCLSIGTVTSTVTGQFYGAVKSSGATIVNSYYKGDNVNGSSSTVTLTATKLSADDARLTSGELCYLLNESQSENVNWFQDLSDDDYPTPNGSDKVYLNGSFYCDGTSKGVTSYGNTDESTIDDHDYVDGVCYYCGAPDETYITPSEGYYEIDTPAKLKWFSVWVNSSSDNLTSNAKLTDDIDMTSIATTWVPIGDWHTGNVNSAYKGHFNGQGHEISNFNVTTSQTYYGIFGVVSAATIENFSIRGTITNNSYSNIGVIGYSRDTEVNIQNIQSYLAITNNGNDKNVGGILGSGNAGTTNIDHCAFFGEIEAVEKTNAGGIIGYSKNGSDAIVNITNCLFNGKISSEISNAWCGGIAGYGGANVNNVKIKNCLSLGTLTAPVTGQFFGNIRNTGSSITNCYYKGDNVNGEGSSTLTTLEATPVIAAQLASGEVAYWLNESTNAGTNWYQTLPASPSGDSIPTLDSTHGLVYVNGTVCPDTGAPQGSVSYSNAEGTTTGSHNYTNGFCSYCDYLQSDYMTPNGEGFYMIGNKEQLVWFAAKVNAGTYNAKAKLTADIDMYGANISHFPIGDASATSKYYTGTFDGQGHKLSNFQLVNTSAATNFGMFNATTGVVLKNFWLDSSCAIEGREMVGLIGHLYGGGTFEGIGNCADVTGIQNNIGGLIGGVTGNSGDKKNITIKNCWTTGTVETTNPSASKGKDCGALTGWFNNAKITINGFWTVADVVNPTSDDKYVYRNGGGATFTISKSFSKNGTQPNYTNFTDEQAANGWLCYNLGSDWYQTIGTDDEPTLDSSSKQVILNGDYENVASTLALDEDYTFGTNSNFDVTSVTMDRTLKGGKWNTFCVPFDMSSSEISSQLGVGTKVKELIGVTDNGGGSYTLAFDDADGIEAGKPYMVRVPSEVTSISLSSKTIKGTIIPITVDDITFTGVFNNGNAPEDSYIISNNKFYQVNSTVALKAFRGYLAVGGGGEVKELNYFIEDDDADGIDMVNGEGFMVNGPIYNLSGQRINKLQKGINIVNGKKVLF